MIDALTLLEIVIIFLALLALLACYIVLYVDPWCWQYIWNNYESPEAKLAIAKVEEAWRRLGGNPDIDGQERFVSIFEGNDDGLGDVWRRVKFVLWDIYREKRDELALAEEGRGGAVEGMKKGKYKDPRGRTFEQGRGFW